MTEPVGTPFDDLPFDPERYERDLLGPLPRKTYGVFFTPRSGSTWLTEIVTKARSLGHPAEFFNPNFVPKNARGMNADNLERYVQLIRRQRAKSGVFGFEITYFQMMRVFGDEATFLGHFPADLPWFYLTREDIVAQAVSLHKAVTTHVFHSSQTEEQRLHESDLAFGYDPEGIRLWLAHINTMEARAEQFFASHGLRPLRLSYEQNIGRGADATVGEIAAALQVRRFRPLDGGTRHQKIGTGKNEEFAARFRQEFPDLCAEVDARRHTTTAGCVME